MPDALVGPVLSRDLADDLIRRVVGLCADIHEANPHNLRHTGSCGERLFCDREEHRAGGYRRVELLRNGDLLLHCEKRALRRGDLGYAERLAGMER